jgi:hypothetical protein
MTFLKSLWRKLFKRTGVFESHDADLSALSVFHWAELKDLPRLPAYDPEQDPEKLLRGEVESYFD